MTGTGGGEEDALASNLEYHGSLVKLDLVGTKPGDMKYNLVVGFSYKERPLFYFTLSNFGRKLSGCLDSLGDFNGVAFDFKGFNILSVEVESTFITLEPT
jgi:hypothetical protein